MGYAKRGLGGGRPFQNQKRWIIIDNPKKTVEKVINGLDYTDIKKIEDEKLDCVTD
jgi:hypothetical protein